MKTTHLSFFLLTFMSIISTKGFGQKQEIKLQPGATIEIEKTKSPLLSTILYSDEKGYLALNYYSVNNESVCFLERINRNMEVIDSIAIQRPPYDNHVQTAKFGTDVFLSGRFFTGFQMLNNKATVFWTVVNKETNEYKLFCQQFDTEKLSPISKLVELASLKSACNWVISNFRTEFDFFKTAVSPDQKLLAVTCNAKSSEKSDSCCQVAMVFNDEFKNIWTKKIVYPFPYYLFDARQTEITNSGDIVMSGLQIMAKQSSILRNSFSFRRYTPYIHLRGQFHISSFSDNGNQISDRVLELKNSNITDMVFAMRENTAVIKGFWNTEENFLDSKLDFSGFIISNGDFTSKFDIKTQEISSVSSSLFPEQYRFDKNGKADPSATPALYNLVAQKIIFLPSSEILLLSESLNFNFISKGSNMYLIGSAYVSRYSENGIMKSMANVIKPDVPSYAPPSLYSKVCYVKNYVYFINKNNIEIVYSRNNIIDKKPESSIYLAEVNESGIVNVTLLAEIKKQKYFKIDYPRSFVDADNNAIVLFGIEGKVGRFWTGQTR
ncbi:hypothetical protein BH09BAC5_BH09BAC5_29060 [soil metagenome]